MRIYADGDTPFVNLEIPYYVHFRETKTDEEYQRLLTEEMSLSSSILFDLIEYLSYRQREADADIDTVSEFVTIIAKLGRGLQGAIEEIEIGFRRRQKEVTEPKQTEVKEKIHYRDLANEYTTSDLAFALTNHPDLSEEKQRELKEYFQKIFTISSDILAQIKTQAPGILDLSNHATAEDECIDLARSLSTVLKNKSIPESLYNAIVDQLTTFPNSREFIDSPEYISDLLCKEVKKNND